MGKGAHGGETRRARRHTGSIVAAAAGATALATAAAVAGWQRRRREQVITPEDSLAGPPPAPRKQPAPAPPAAPTAPAAPISPPAAPAAPVSPGPPGAPRSPAPLLPTVTVGDASAAAPTPPSERPPPVRDTPVPTGTAVRAVATGTAVPTDPPHLAAPERRRLPRGWAVVTGLALVLVLGIGALVLAGGGGDDAEAADPRPAGDTAASSRPTTTTTAPVAAVDAFAVASQRLTDAGSFSYTGTASATDVSVARPMLWLAVATTVEGQVVVPTGRLHEVSVADDGSATETVAAVAQVWGRRASTVAGLEGEPYEALPGLSGDAPAGRGAALLPWWLAGAVAPSELGPDEQGRRTFQATIPAALMGVVEREQAPVDATVTLAIDDDGDPASVEIVSSPDGPPFHLVFEISGLGDPVVVETPADATAATASTTP